MFDNDDNKSLNKQNDEEETEESADAESSGETRKEQDVEKLKQDVLDFENKWKRALADYQNLERRYEAGRRDLILSANKDLILKLLPVLDTLILASDHVKDEGLRLSIQKFLDVLNQEGVERIKTEGKAFDPALMEATEVIKGSKDKVIEEVRGGFILNDKVLRPAQVKVGKGENK